MPHKPRLLVLTSTFPRWRDDPEPPFVFELSRRLTDTFEITVLAPRAPGSLSEEQMDGLRVIRFGYFFRRWENLATHGGGILNRLRLNPWHYLLVPFFLAGQFWALTRLLRREPFEVIHSHWIIPQGFVARLALARSPQRPSLVCTSHGGDLYALRGLVMSLIKRWILAGCFSVSVVSHAMQREARRLGVPPERIAVLPMGVDLLQRFTPDPSVMRHEAELLFVGRLVEKKGVDLLIRALAQVAEKYPRVRLVIAGDGPLRSTLQELATALRVAHRIDFLGMINQDALPNLYRRATLFVAPFVVAGSGDQEGFPVAPQEAIGCCCPLICGRVSAFGALIRDRQEALLPPPGDIAALVESISTLLGDPIMRQRLAKNARQRCLRRCDWTPISSGYRELLLTAAVTAVTS